MRPLRRQPEWLHIECAENSVLTGGRTSDALQEIEKLGVQISLDDFGVGYSNIACLNRLPVSLLKLDRSLVAPIATDFRAWTLAQSLIDFGHCLGYRMLAEGVEDAETYEMLSKQDATRFRATSSRGPSRRRTCYRFSVRRFQLDCWSAERCPAR